MKKTTSGKMKDPLTRGEELRIKVIDAIAQTMDLYGVNYSFGQLYGIMFFEDKSMTLEDMQNHMNMSKSNMSYAVRALTASKMLIKLKEKEDRKDLYAAETDFFVAFQLFFATKLQREIDVMLEAINSVIPELSTIILHLDTPEDERTQCLKDLHKLKHAISYYDWLQSFVDDLQRDDYFVRRQRVESAEQRGIQIAGLDHLVLTVSSIEAATAFYNRVLGMETVTDGEGETELKFGSQLIYLHEAGHEYKRRANASTIGAADLCLISTTTIDEITRHLEAFPMMIETGPVTRTGAQGSIESVYIRDPDHHLIEIAVYH